MGLAIKNYLKVAHYDRKVIGSYAQMVREPVVYLRTVDFGHPTEYKIDHTHCRLLPPTVHSGTDAAASSQ